MTTASGKPLYVQIADDLQEQIDNGVYKPRDKMASENELCAAYQTSRLTIRRALSELEQKGQIYRVHGLGTFVSPFSQNQSFGFGGFTERCENLGIKAGAVVIRSEVVAHLPESMWSYQKTPPESYPDDRYYYLERVRTMNGKRVVVERVYLPLYLYPRLETDFDPETSLYRFLQEVYQIKRHHTQAVVLPSLTTKEDRDLYGIEAGVPILQGFMTVWAQNHQVMEYSNPLYSSDFPLRFIWEN